jgi:soluble lytic murein transglycosylase-like protein
LRLKLWAMLAILTLLGTTPAISDSALDTYLALRRANQTDKLQVSQVRSSPGSYIGKVFELRGTLTGSATNSTAVTMIIEASDGSYVVASPEDHHIHTGSRICALVQVGEKCTLSLSDLRLLSVAYEPEVAERERRFADAEAARTAAATAAAQRKVAVRERTRRIQNPVSRSTDYTPEAYVTAYKRAIKSYNSRLSDAEAETIARSILGFGTKYRVDPRLVVAVILTESHFRLEATSRKGAMGLGQLMPGTAAGLGVSNAYNPVENIAASVRLIRGHLDRMSGRADWNDLTWRDLSLALASYNAGPGAVRKYGGVPPYRETRNYVNRICTIYKQLCGQQ